MADTGAVSPTAATSVAASGDRAWSNVTNMLASDNSRATTTDLVAGRTTETANLTTFGFSIPSTATIDGIIVAIERSASAGGTVTDLAVKLIKGGTISGTNKADTVTTWPTTDGTVTYGGASDLWGLTLLYSDVNASNFGVSISATGVGGAGFPQVDHVTITAYYTDAGGGGQPMALRQSHTRQGFARVGRGF